VGRQTKKDIFFKKNIIFIGYIPRLTEKYKSCVTRFLAEEHKLLCFSMPRCPRLIEEHKFGYVSRCHVTE
jgi:hypothetical protein